MFFGPSEIILHEQTVAFIDQSTGIIAVVVDSDVYISFCIVVVSFQEVEETDV